MGFKPTFGLVLTLLLLILFPSVIFAYDLEPMLTYTTGNAGIDRLGSFSNTYMTSPYASTQSVDGGEIFKCEVTTSTNPILTADFNGDSYPDFLITTPTNIKIYDSRCNPLADYAFTSTSIPVLNDINNDLHEEIVISNSTNLLFLTYNSSISSLSVVRNIKYYNNFTYTPKEVLCTREADISNEKFCVLVAYGFGSFNMTKISFGSFSTPFNVSNVTITNQKINPTGNGDSFLNYPGITYANAMQLQIGELNKYVILMPISRWTGVTISGYTHFLLLNSSLSIIMDYDTGLGSQAYPDHVYSTDLMFSYMTYIGSQYCIVYGIMYTNVYNSHMQSFKVLDTSGNVLADLSSLCDRYIVMSSPFLKSTGTKYLACMKATVGYSTNLRAFNSDFSYEDYEIGNFSDLGNCVLADFNNSMPVLGLTCNKGYYGIYSKDLSGFGVTQMMYNATSNTPSRTYPVTVAQDYVNYKPYVGYSDGTYTHLIQWVGISDTCGDLVCQSDENEYTCPIDCNQTTQPPVLGYCGDGICYGTEANIYDVLQYCPADCLGSHQNCTYSCVNNAMCVPYGFNTCLSGCCVQTNGSTIYCQSDASCPYNMPHCDANLHICVADTLGGNGTIVTPIQSSDPSITRALNMLFAGSQMLKFIIAMILIVMVSVWAASAAHNGFIGAFAGVCMFLLFSAIGFVPSYILIIVVIIITLIVMFLMFFKPSGG